MTGNNRAGLQHIMNNLLVYQQWGPGSVEETLNGDVYKPNGVCSHQCWSETMVLQPAIEGMLGLETDALAGMVKLSPYFPWDWQRTTVKNIRSGSSTLQLAMSREKDQTSFVLTASDPVYLNFNPKFPFLTRIGKVLVNGQEVTLQESANAEGLTLHIPCTLKQGENKITIEHSGGIGALPLIATPVPGERSKEARILSEKVEGGVYSVVVEGLPGTRQEVCVFAKVQSMRLQGAELIEENGPVMKLQVELPPSATEKYMRKEIRLFIK
jgi:hypothetical protein